jgi:hypothetical protein
MSSAPPCAGPPDPVWTVLRRCGENKGGSGSYEAGRFGRREGRRAHERRPPRLLRDSAEAGYPGRGNRPYPPLVEHWTGPASVRVNGYQVYVDTTRPAAVDAYRRGAELAHTIDSDGHGYAFVALNGPEDKEPSLVVEGNFEAAGGRGPGVLVVPETRQVFIGTGVALSAFDRRNGRWRQTWVDEAELGFWDWSQHGDVVLMSAELEFAAWRVDGTKLWSRFVEPPWSFVVRGDDIRLDVMGTVTNLPLHDGG